MLKILEAQMDHFARRSAKDYEDRVVAHLPEACPALVSGMSAVEIRARVRAGMDKAARYGITREPDALELILMLLALGPAADEELAWVRAIVTDRDLDGSGKIRLLEKTGRRVLRGEEEVEVAS
jgi:hypothetical protein